MSLSLLNVVQDMLMSIQGDQVSDINGTVEATRCHYIARQVFLDFISNTVTVPELQDIRQLESVGDVTDPTKLLIPSDFDEIIHFEYRKPNGVYTYLEYLSPQDFTCKTESYRSLTGAQEVSYKDINLTVRTDQHPKYWTSYDDQFVLLDSYEISVEASVVGPKTRVQVMLSGPSIWVESNTFVIPISTDAVSTYLNECKERAWAEIKEKPNGLIQSKARRERAKLHHGPRVLREAFTSRYPNYARR